jgi:hypothetical protein
MAAGGSGFASTDHQGKTRMLQVIHNTIITTGRGVNLSSWNDREGMVFANNAVCSKRGPGIRFPNGAKRVNVSGNVVFGGVDGVRRGFVNGRGLSDFVSVSWDGNRRDATPSQSSRLLGAADPSHALTRDLRGNQIAIPPAAGAFSR